MTLAKYIAPMIVLVCLVTAGCATSEDPRAGGLFGYNPDAYQRRIDSRESQLQGLQQEQMQGQQTRGYLEQERSSKLAQKQRLERDLAGLEGEIASIQRKIAKVKLDTQAQRDRHRRISQELKAVNAELTRIKNTPDPENEARIKEIKRLQKKLDALLEEAEALSKM